MEENRQKITRKLGAVKEDSKKKGEIPKTPNGICGSNEEGNEKENKSKLGTLGALGVLRGGNTENLEGKSTLQSLLKTRVPMKMIGKTL